MRGFFFSATDFGMGVKIVIERLHFLGDPFNYFRFHTLLLVGQALVKFGSAFFIEIEKGFFLFDAL